MFITKNQLMGEVAKWSVSQSPYHRPENLEFVLDKFYDGMKPHIETDGILEFENQEALQKFILDKLSAIPEFIAWNERKNGDQAPYGFVSRYDQPEPDNDFIDIEALAQNAARELAKEAALL